VKSEWFEVNLPFGRSQKERKSVGELPSNYLRWLLEQDFFERQYEELVEPVEQELEWRTNQNCHFYDD